MMKIKKLESGFYALWNGEMLIDAALVKWDGRKGTEWAYNTEADKDYCLYCIDAKNNVYYSVYGGDTGLWCNGQQLSRHCHFLQQIKAR